MGKYSCSCLHGRPAKLLGKGCGQSEGWRVGSQCYPWIPQCTRYFSVLLKKHGCSVLSSAWHSRIKACFPLPSSLTPHCPLLCVCAKSLQSSPALCDPTDCSLPGSSICGILQAAILEWVTMPSTRESFRPRDQTHILHYLHWQAGSLPPALLGKSSVTTSQKTHLKHICHCLGCPL